MLLLPSITSGPRPSRFNKRGEALYYLTTAAMVRLLLPEFNQMQAEHVALRMRLYGVMAIWTMRHYASKAEEYKRALRLKMARSRNEYRKGNQWAQQ